ITRAGTGTPQAKDKEAETKPKTKTQARDKPEQKPTTERKQRAPRRKAPPRRPPLPPAKRELLISLDVGEQRFAMLEGSRVAEAYLERPERRSVAGNIYLGVVESVLPGIEAASIEGA